MQNPSITPTALEARKAAFLLLKGAKNEILRSCSGCFHHIGEKAALITSRIDRTAELLKHSAEFSQINSPSKFAFDSCSINISFMAGSLKKRVSFQLSFLRKQLITTENLASVAK